MRGGTSRGVMLPEKELPAREEWDDLFVRCMGRRGLAHSPPSAAFGRHDLRPPLNCALFFINTLHRKMKYVRQSHGF